MGLSRRVGFVWVPERWVRLGSGEMGSSGLRRDGFVWEIQGDGFIWGSCGFRETHLDFFFFGNWESRVLCYREKMENIGNWKERERERDGNVGGE